MTKSESVENTSREELLALAQSCSLYNFDSVEFVECKHKLWADILARLTAKPADDGVREATIEECAKVADMICADLSEHSKRAEDAGDLERMYRANTAWHRANEISVLIRALQSPNTGDGK